MDQASPFWSLVNFTISPSRCWVWCGDRTDFHHGVFRGLAAHRVAFELHHGRQIGVGAVIRHRCDNSPCVNPAHLAEGMPWENNEDTVKRGRAGWQRKKLATREDKLLYAVVSEWARSIGMDPYTLWAWLQEHPDAIMPEQSGAGVGRGALARAGGSPW